MGREALSRSSTLSKKVGDFYKTGSEGSRKYGLEIPEVYIFVKEDTGYVSELYF